MGKRSPLVGRAVERAGLDAALARCRRGEGGLVLISGDAGVGKSRLVEDALADWDGPVLRGAATAGAGGYAPIVEIVRAVSDQFGDEALPGIVRVLLPELSAHGSPIDQPAMHSAIRRTLRDVALRQPAVVVLEDLHWADAATVELLPVLAVAMAGESLLLLATYRSTELPRSHPVRGMRTELRRTGHFVEFALCPLTAAETGELLAGLFDTTGSPDLVSAVHGRAEGLPFFVEEFAAVLAETGGLSERDGVLDLAPGTVLPMPDGVLDAVLVRTAGLRQQYQAAVELVRQ